MEDHFDEEKWRFPAVVGHHEDPIGDRIPNLLKYALGLDPWQSYPSALPPPEIRTVGGIER